MVNYNFKKYTHGEADYYGEGYDYDSIMHYGNWYFSKNGKMTIEVVSDPYKIVGQRDGFSQTDVRQLNKVYRCKGYENVKVPALKGCIDMSNGCTSSAQRGECDRSPRYMLKYCCKSCKEFLYRAKEETRLRHSFSGSSSRRWNMQMRQEIN
eukprot:gene15381-biopygen12806